MTQSTQAFAPHASLQARWKALAPRERNLVLAAVAVVALALLWWLALAPALATLRAAPARHAELDAQVQRMQALQAEAQQLQSAPRSSPADSVGTLRAALTQRLGTTGQLNVVGDRVTVVLKGAPADGLAPWLAQARSNAHASPVEARLVRSTAAASPAAAGAAGAASPGAAPTGAPRWDGTLVLALPAGR